MPAAPLPAAPLPSAPPPLPVGHRVVVTAFAERPPEAIANGMHLEPMEAPDPAALGPGDCIVAVRSCAVGWVDLLMTSGLYQHLPHPPYTPGLECAGEVVYRGPAVPGSLPIGARVIVDGMRAGPRSMGPYQRWGGFASYVVAPAEALVPIPGGLSFDAAAALLGSYETAYHCLVTRGRLSAGETVLIHGATGATGLAAVQVAVGLGATVIATGRSPEKLAEVAAAGAAHTVPLRFEDGALVRFRDEVKALTGGAGVDVVYDPVGGAISLESLRCIRFGGRFLIVGWSSTPFVADGGGRKGAPNANQLPTNLMMMKGLDVLGCPTVISTVMDPASRAPRLQAVLAGAEAGLYRPHVSHRFPLSDFQAAMTAKWEGAVTGGCVVHP